MQHSIQLKLSAEQHDLLKNDSSTMSGILQEIIPSNSDQIGYMLQAYYPRQKVSKVAVVADSTNLIVPGSVNLKISYVVEEFSACSAIDSEDKQEMPVNVKIGEVEGTLNLTGEYWPSLD